MVMYKEAMEMCTKIMCTLQEKTDKAFDLQWRAMCFVQHLVFLASKEELEQKGKKFTRGDFARVQKKYLAIHLAHTECAGIDIARSGATFLYPIRGVELIRLGKPITVSLEI